MLQNLAVPQKDISYNAALGISKNKAWTQDLPAWMRLTSGILGFLTSFLLVGLPAIALIIIDRVIPSGSSNALLKFFYLGATTVISVCLIELMRMKALQRYVVNVRGVIFFQDSCFALFWAFLIGFIHPLLAMPSVVGAVVLFIAWKLRKPLQKELLQETDLPDFEAEKIDACGLGPAFYEMAAQGKFPSIQRLDFQTLSQWLIPMNIVSDSFSGFPWRGICESMSRQTWGILWVQRYHFEMTLTATDFADWRGRAVTAIRRAAFWHWRQFMTAVGGPQRRGSAT